LTFYLFAAAALVACGSSGGGSHAIEKNNVIGDGSGAIGTVSAPENVQVTASDGTAEITWDAVAGATSYNVYWSDTPDVSKVTFVEKIVEDTSPCIHTGLTNGDTYYYVVTAIGPEGEGPESLMVGATPRQPLDAPQFVSAKATPDTTNSITITWVDVIGATSYNLYFSDVAGVTKENGTQVLFATSPYVHTGVPGQSTYYYVITSVNDTVFPVNESDESPEVSATARGPKTPVGGHTGFGNNLSVPVVFANGYGMSGQQIDGTVAPERDYATGLRPTDTEMATNDSLLRPFPYFDPNKTISLGGVVYWPQATTSTWQAEWDDGSGEIQNVTAQWGDNLVSAPLRTTQMIRVETVLTQDNTADNMEGFNMQSLYGSMRNEVFGTDGLPGYLYSERMVFSPNARLKIEQLDANGNPIATTFNKAIYESFGVEGPGGYASEINGKGSLVYGYNWKATSAGAWRLTFSLDNDCGVIIPNCDNTVIDGVKNGTLINDHEIRIEVNVQ
jgi:hypothetical protein